MTVGHKMTCRNVCNGVVLVFLLIVCTVLFILHSLYFIFRFTESSMKEQIKTVTEPELYIPALVICNQMPFSQDGINSVSSNIRQDTSIRYLREWTNPSMREKADFFPVAPSYLQQGNQILTQYISPINRNQSLQRMEYQCQSVIGSCTYQNVLLTSYDCCKNLLYAVPTTNGLCWLVHDRSMSQNSTGVNKQLHILFQISRNSWYSSSYLPTHPGVDVYLREDGDDIVRLGSELGTPLRLSDKRGLRLRMHQERRALTRRLECGQAVSDARSADNKAYQGNRTNLLLCNIMVSMRHCNCHPILAEMLPYNIAQFRDFSLMVNSTNVCGVEQYDSCSRQYIDLARPSHWESDIPRQMTGYEELQKCRKDNHRPCLLTSYPGTIDQYDLPAEYQSTQDFVSRLSLEYTSMQVTEVLESKDPNLYEMLSFIGYNLALWFCVGHIIWSLYAGCCNAVCTRKTNKVSPTRNLIISSPVAVPTIAPVEVKDEQEAQQVGAT